MPVASILFVGAGLLGAGTLKDLSLVLFVGMLSGTYSSIFIATPVLADLKEREPGTRNWRAGRAARPAAAAPPRRPARGPWSARPPAATHRGGTAGRRSASDRLTRTSDRRQRPDDGVTVSAAAGRAGLGAAGR